MSEERIRGSVRMAAAGQLAGTFGTSAGGTSRGAAPTELENPTVLTGPGVYYMRMPDGIGTMTIEQRAAGGNGADGTSAAGGTGGGGGAYCKMTWTGALVASGGVMTIQVGRGNAAELNDTHTQCKSSGGSATVLSRSRNADNEQGTGGVNTVTAGTGQTVVTNTAGAAGSAPATTTGGAGGAGAHSGGAGGAGGKTKLDGAAGTAPGGGGGGGGSADGGPTSGGKGGNGSVSITW